MQRSKLKNRKSNRKLNSKLRNKCGGAAGKSPDRPGRSSRSRRSSSRSKRSSSRSKSSKHVRSKSDELLQRVVDSRPALESILAQSNNKSLENLLEAVRINRRILSEVEAGIEHKKKKKYAFLIDIYDNPELKEAIEKIKQINLTDKKNYYLQNAEKLKEIQQVYKNKELTEKEDKIERTGTMIHDLIAIFFKDFNLHKSKKTTSSLENYMNYLSKKSSKFDKYSEDINKDIDKDIAILTLFYGFSDIDLRLIFIYTGNKSVILNDYIYLLNELFTKHTGEKFYTHFDLITSVPGVAHWLNREGIKEYVKKITDSKKPHAEVLKELKENSEFLRPKDN